MSTVTTLAPPASAPEPTPGGSGPDGGGLRTRWQNGNLHQGLMQGVVAFWMNLLILAVVAATVATAGFLSEGRWPEQTTWGVGALKLFALWCLAFLPGWLYIRFLRMRGLALWTEYVLVLHRLGWDESQNLPRPPEDSEYHREWQSSHRRNGRSDIDRQNIYRQKFEAYYGRTIPARMDEWRGSGTDVQDFRVRGESLFPIFLATLVFAVGWAACLWDTRFLDTPEPTIWVLLKYGFLGAYLFVLSMLVRRFFQSDLKPSAYASGVLRIIVVLFVVAILFHLMPELTPAGLGTELAAAFLVGFFPLIGLQLIRRVVAKALGGVVPPITSEHPLDQIDGVNLWYEARLLEEGVEDMQNLATMNLVDVVLHTRVPTGRLVDWIDQAHLLLRLGPLTAARKRTAPARGDTWLSGPEARDRLRRAGIRGATDLLRGYSDVEDARRNHTRPVYRRPAHTDPEQLPLPESHLSLLVSVLGVEEGLAPVWNWKRNGVRTCRPATADRSGVSGHRFGRPPRSPRRARSGRSMEMSTATARR